MSASKRIGAYDARIGDIADVDVDSLHALSLSMGWPHHDRDWAWLLEIGRGVAARDEIGRVLGTAMWFPCDDAHATVGMVLTSPKLQANGTGLWLMRNVIDQAGTRALRLHATSESQRLYNKLSFEPGKTLFQRQGIAASTRPNPSAAPAGDIRVLTAEHLPAMLALDKQAFSARREQIVRSLFAHSTGFGLFRSGSLAAFALCRSFGRGWVIGPTIASSDEDAIAIVSPHLNDRAGTFVRLDSYVRIGRFAEFLGASGLADYDTALTMSLGTFRPGEMSHGAVIYGVASQTLG